MFCFGLGLLDLFFNFCLLVLEPDWTELVDTLTRLGFDYETLVDEDGNIAVVWSEAVLEFLQPIYAVVVSNRIFKIAGDSIAVTTGMRTSAVFADPIEPIVAMKTARVTNLEP